MAFDIWIFLMIMHGIAFDPFSLFPLFNYTGFSGCVNFWKAKITPRSQLNSKGAWGKWNYLWPRMWLLLTKIYFTVGFQLYSKLSFYIIALLIINLFFPSNTSTPPVLSHCYSPTPMAWFLYSMWHLSTLDCNILGWLNMSPHESIKFLTQIWHYPNK